MIPFEKNRQQTIPESSVKIIGLGGAGANMLDRVALDGLEGAELLALNTDVRTLSSSVAGEKIQLGRNLTKGLGTGGDPKMGENAVLEAEAEIRDALRERLIVFICVGLGGGTGSGAAPIVTRLAREAGAFTVVFATMPFSFEGGRRREQAEKSLNELAVLSNALVTFDNGRMGELVLPKQGVHEAFSAADRMISESIRAVSRLVIRPGLINVGLDELMTALETTRSRCLFGSGLARGESRAQEALKLALESPLLDRGQLLKEAATVLVHICGGEDLTMFEVELLMESLTKHIPDDAHLLFGAATDPLMNDALSVTVISALPEDQLRISPFSQVVEDVEEEDLEEELDEDKVVKVLVVDEDEEDEMDDFEDEDEDEEDEVLDDEEDLPDDEDEDEDLLDDEEDEEDEEEVTRLPFRPIIHAAEDEEEEDEEEVEEEFEEVMEDEEEVDEDEEVEEEDEGELDEDFGDEIDDVALVNSQLPLENGGQGQLELDGGPKGRFAGEEPNMVDGEDLDVPPYLRKRKRR